MKYFLVYMKILQFNFYFLFLLVKFIFINMYTKLIYIHYLFDGHAFVSHGVNGWIGKE